MQLLHKWVSEDYLVSMKIGVFNQTSCLQTLLTPTKIVSVNRAIILIFFYCTPRSKVTKTTHNHVFTKRFIEERGV